MPPRLQRIYGYGHLHFITGSCHGRQPYLSDPARRDLFLQMLEEVRQSYRFVVVGYVVMPEHFHLLIGEPQQGTPTTVMQVLKQRFALRMSEKPVWQRRFYDFNVFSDPKRIEKLRYIHRNPVERGLVMEPEQWKWSSYRSYAFGEMGHVRINEWWPVKIKKAG